MDIHINVYDPDEMVIVAQCMQTIAAHRLRQQAMQQQQQMNLQPPACSQPGSGIAGSAPDYYGSIAERYFEKAAMGVALNGTAMTRVTCDDGGKVALEMISEANMQAAAAFRAASLEPPSPYLSEQERLWAAIEAAAKP